MKTIIWDWNGTLLDDTDICIQVVNGMLRKRNLPEINFDIYQAQFGFPVKNFYKKIGFDLSDEGFEDLAVEYIEAYLSDFNRCSLQPHVEDTLKRARDNGYQNYVLSAMEQRTLEKSVSSHGLSKFFVGLKGITDFHAKGKIERGRELFDEQQIDSLHTILVGDTTHDFEVAQGLECNCILVGNGHYSAQRLRQECPVQVVNNVSEAWVCIQHQFNN
ncbi:MAG: HAD hydrolase-like protein [Bacteroidetes bacterium]|jgi:phosphoglycolate phosphatase|nr:HAD hydrolase-like protein [Bacteroidota bacterium]